ncbi:MAG: hypothetical protein PUD93_04025 [Lachnospiraceae bacterium]|nr:hypothetical protein [Lachnospiraceae bacterium]
MLINKLQSIDEFRELDLPKDYLQNLSEHSTDELLDIISKVIEVMLRHLKVSEKEVIEFTGRAEGRELVLISMVCKKLLKNKSLAQIAEELEEEESKIANICHVAEKFAPEYDAEKILEAMKERKE